MLCSYLLKHAPATSQYQRLFLKLCKPTNVEYALYLKTKKIIYSMGEYCTVMPDAIITNPKYLRMGNNVRLSSCTIHGHDGSINMLKRAYNCQLDRVGKVDLKDNVYIGYGAIVLPNVCIGPNAIVGAGAVVAKDVPPNSVVVGAPAKVIGTLDASVEKLKKQTEQLPWAHLLPQLGKELDEATREEMLKIRLKYFFGEDSP